jgi:hypothetical protein
MCSGTGSASTIDNNIGKYYSWAITSDPLTNKFWPLPGNHVRRRVSTTGCGRSGVHRVPLVPLCRFRRKPVARRSCCAAFAPRPTHHGTGDQQLDGPQNTHACPARHHAAPLPPSPRGLVIFCRESQDWGNTCPCATCLNPYLNYFKVLANQRYYARQARAPSPAPCLRAAPLRRRCARVARHLGLSPSLPEHISTRMRLQHPLTQEHA